MEMYELPNLENECLKCGKKNREDLKNQMCLTCRLYHASLEQKAQSRIYKFFRKYDFDTKIRIINFLEEQEKIFPF